MDENNANETYTQQDGSLPLWTVEDVADYLRVSPETVRSMARRGELPSIKVGKRVWRFKFQDLMKWVNKQ